MREAAANALTVRISQAAPIPLDVTLDCGANELLALVGPSGSGKTTILRTIAGLVRPGHGRVTAGGEVWFDHDASIDLPPQQRRVGLVFQDYALLPHLSALDNVAMAVDRGDRTMRRETAAGLLARVNLSGLEARMPQALSGGQQQRVALARALAREPRVLLLDEPFSAVDQMTRERLKRELAVLRRSLGCPIVLVTHDIDEALALADRMAVLHRGRLLQSGAPDEVRLRPVSAAVARLMGEPNVFTGVIDVPAGAGRPGRLDWAGHCLEMATTGAAARGDTVMWMIPAEAIVLHRRDRPSHGEKENPVAGTLVELTRLGAETAVTLAVDGSADLLRFRLPTHVARRNDLAVDAAVSVSLLASSLHLLAKD